MFGAGGMKVNARLWLKMLQQWLERPEAVENNVNSRRIQQDRTHFEVRKAQATAWYLSPPY
jgi:hypothetical protein